MKHLKIYEEFENENELNNSIKEYLLNEYPSDWWENEFQNRVYDYCSEEEWVGEDGDPDDESTWDYSGPEEAYQNFCNGGAIEYDLMEEIREDILNKFHMTDEEYFTKGTNKIVEDHMCNMIDWYDHGLFGPSKVDNFGFKQSTYDNLTKGWDVDTKNLPSEYNGIKL